MSHTDRTSCRNFGPLMAALDAYTSLHCEIARAQADPETTDPAAALAEEAALGALLTAIDLYASIEAANILKEAITSKPAK